MHTKYYSKMHICTIFTVIMESHNWYAHGLLISEHGSFGRCRNVTPYTSYCRFAAFQTISDCNHCPMLSVQKRKSAVIQRTDMHGFCLWLGQRFKCVTTFLNTKFTGKVSRDYTNQIRMMWNNHLMLHKTCTISSDYVQGDSARLLCKSNLCLLRKDVLKISHMY